MIKIKEAIIVEGRYDKIKLSSIIDGLIIETGGFQIFSNKDRLALIRRLAKTRGILILTDSDSAGFIIRNFLNGAIPKCKIKHAYIPDIYGKERRKSKSSKEGKLGVEGVPEHVIVEAIRRSGVLFETYNLDSPATTQREITKLDLYEYGFSGKHNSAEKRKSLLKHLELPEHLSTNSLNKVLNCIMSYDEYVEVSKLIK